MAYIEFKDVIKAYGEGDARIHALDGASFTVERGELAIILGASGAGKTTALNILGGMDTATSGTVTVDGRDVSSANEAQLVEYRRADVGFVFQFYNLVPNLTALENVELAAQICPDSLDAEQTLRQVGLGERLGNFPAQLSGGEQQMLVMGRALMSNPKLLMLDEPSMGLAPILIEQIFQIVEDLHKAGTTVLLVSHSMEDIAKYVERLIVMNHGEMVFDDTPKNVFSHYKELEEMGLAAPQITYIMHALSENGLNVDTTATTVEEARDTILEALKKQKPSLLKKGGRNE